MTSYAKITDFASKDALLTGNPAKIVKGVEIDDEFNAIATADATSVKGPIGVTVDNTVVRWDGTTGRAVQGSGVTISDADVVTASGFTGPHNGTVGATTPSTGAFTTLSASGDINQTTGGASDISMFSNNSAGSARFGVRASGNAVVLAGTGKSLELWANNSQIGTVSSTGLAVTGALSATGSLGSISTTSTGNRVTFSRNGANYINCAGASGSMNYAAASHSFYDETETTAFLNIDTAGNLGLGVTPSAWAVNSKAIQMGTVAAFAQDANGGTNILNNAFESAAGVYTYRNTSAAARYSQLLNTHAWYTAPSGTAGNAITFTQSLAFGNGTTLALEGATSAAGTGIAFPATQLASSNANTLDDYEEGTFTPVVYGSSSGGAGTYSTQVGSYTKVGNKVSFQINLVWSAHSGTGNLLMGTLPFTSNGTAGRLYPCANYNAGIAMTAGNVMQTYIINSSTAVVLEQVPTGGGSSVAIPIDAVGQLMVSGTYFV